MAKDTKTARASGASAGDARQPVSTATDNERGLWLDYVSASLALAREVETEATSACENLEAVYTSGNLPEATMRAARSGLTQARLQVARLEALAKLIAAVPVDRLTVSLSV